MLFRVTLPKDKRMKSSLLLLQPEEIFLLVAESSSYKQRHSKSIRVCTKITVLIMENDLSIEGNSTDLTNCLLAFVLHVKFVLFICNHLIVTVFEWLQLTCLGKYNIMSGRRVSNLVMYAPIHSCSDLYVSQPLTFYSNGLQLQFAILSPNHKVSVWTGHISKSIADTTFYLQSQIKYTLTPWLKTNQSIHCDEYYLLNS